MSIENIVRKPLLRAFLEKKPVSAVDVREIRFQPGQQTGLHRHPCPVFGYIASGSAVLEVEGEAPQALPQGSAFHEPEGAVIRRFDNASSTEPMTFIVFYLLKGDEPFIEMLPEKTA